MVVCWLSPPTMVSSSASLLRVHSIQCPFPPVRHPNFSMYTWMPLTRYGSISTSRDVCCITIRRSIGGVPNRWWLNPPLPTAPVPRSTPTKTSVVLFGFTLTAVVLPVTIGRLPVCVPFTTACRPPTANGASATRFTPPSPMRRAISGSAPIPRDWRRSLSVPVTSACWYQNSAPMNRSATRCVPSMKIAADRCGLAARMDACASTTVVAAL